MFEEFIGKRIVLVDRVFAVQEGRIVYPTTVGTLLAATDAVLAVKLSDDAEEPTLFFTDALRCVRRFAEPVQVPATAEAPATEG